MIGDDRLKIFGLYVSQSVFETLSDHVYEAAGVVDLEEYFDPETPTVPADDPGAEATDAILSAVVSDFASLYDEADFDGARALEPDAFVLVHVAAEPGVVANARELFEAAARIQDTDLRTVQTAILTAYASAREFDDGDRGG